MTREEIVQQEDLLGYRGEMREEYLKQEFKLLVEGAAIAKKEETVGNTSKFSDTSAKQPKLPHFQDRKDDLDIWLTRFERFAESNNWSRNKCQNGHRRCVHC
ncbi:hypothetical protein ElyMa_002230000 [Elysia marginata]|uniref:Uncharacterized protein n=1 Tax=Elysia marginata TaxID=1093978 RepID=A0AAV4FXT4_9GAST|nr:hypothetical protein ElyMa_002230000 [Elysia marginata]